MKAYLFLAVAVLLNVTGQLFLKSASLRGGADASPLAVFLSAQFMVGVATLGVGTALWVLALRHIPMTVAHPISGIAYAIVPLASVLLWPAERLPAARIAGIACIIAGIALVARGELW